MKKNYLLRLAMFVCSVLLLTGCSISYSVDKSSDSVTQSSDSISASFDSFSSISDSSGSGGGEVSAAFGRFLDDVSGLARIWSEKQEDPDDFEHQLGALALSYGIADWEQEPRIFYAIGSGLRQAGAAPGTITGQHFLQSPVMIQHNGLIVSGYRGT